MICEHLYRPDLILHISSYTKLSSPKLPLRFFEPFYQDFPDCEGKKIVRKLIK